MPPLLEIKGLNTHLATDDGMLQAVDGVDLSTARRSAWSVIRLRQDRHGNVDPELIAMPPGRIAEGQIIFEGRDLVPLTSHN